MNQNKSNQEKSMKKFMIIWIGQFVSILGSGLTTFGLSVWVLEATGSAMTFTMTVLMRVLPGIIFAPIAGTFADRKNRKNIIIFTDAFDALLKIFMIILLITGQMKLWMIFPINFISAVFGTFQSPAFTASIPEIVPKKNLGRANGMMQLIPSIQNIIAPVVAGALYPLIDLSGLLTIDFITFFVAIGTVVSQKIPQPVIEDKRVNMGNIINDFKYTLTYLKGKQGFFSLIAVFALLNFIANLCIVLVGPIIMGNYNSVIYGMVNSISGIALVLGGLVASTIPTIKNRVKAIFISLILSGIGLCVMGVSPLWYIIGVGFFIFMLPVPFTNATLGTIMQVKIEGKVLGRVGAVIDGLLKIITPVAIVLSGVLAEKVFNPLLIDGGTLSNTWIGSLIGVGKNRGIGLMFILSGLILIVVCVLMLFNKVVMNLEENNPDAVLD